MNAEEIIMLYNINDPVYQGLIKWRVDTLKKWYEKYAQGKTHKVLEIGTGNFPFTLSFGRDTYDIEYFGLEPDKKMQERAEVHAKDKFKKSEVVSSLWNEETIKKYNLTNSFDMACSFEVFEHVPSEHHFTHNVNKALKDDGLFIVETPNTQVTPLFVKVFGQDPNGAGDYENTEHVNEKGFHELFLELRNEGFEILDFDCYYLPVSLWHDQELQPHVSERLYELIHTAAKEFPFYSYVQMFLARKIKK